MLNLATLCFKACEDLASVVPVTSLINDPSTYFYLHYGSHKKVIFECHKGGVWGKGDAIMEKTNLNKNFFFHTATFFSYGQRFDGH